MAKPKETQAQKESREEQERLDAEDMGTGSAARDGEPVNLDERRRGRTGAQLATDGSDGQAAQAEESDGQQAWDVDPTGKKMSLGTLCPRGVPVELKVKVQGKGVTLRGGINDPQSEQIAVSALSVEGFDVRYTRDGTGTIIKTTVTEIKVPKSMNPATSEAGQMMLNGGQSAETA